MAKIETDRVIHRITQPRLAIAALISEQWYRRIARDPSLGTDAVLSRLELALRGLIAANAKSRAKASTTPALLLPTFGGFFVLAAQHYRLCPIEARARLVGQEKPADPIWRAASHSRQAAIYLVNSALAVTQSELAAVLGLTPAAVCLGLKQVEDRRDDPVFDAFLERAQVLVMGI